jgi:enoyl-CoA hydratase
MSDSTPASAVTLEHEGPVARIIFDDGKANALSLQAIAQLNQALDQIEDESAARAVVLAGRPGRFSAGFDLRVMQAGPEAMRQLVRDGAQLMARLFLFPCPVVVACTGHALAAGAVMLLTPDTCIGADGEFKIGLNEVSIGLPLPVFAVELGRARLSGRQLMEAACHARIYDPAGAQQVGFLHQVVPAEQVVDRAMDHARQLAQTLVPGAYHQTKLRARQAIAHHILDTLDDDLASFGFAGSG